MAQMGICGRWLASFKHQRIADEDSHAGGATIPTNAALIHIIESVHNGLQFGRIMWRDALASAGCRNAGIAPFEHTFRPGSNLVTGYLRLKKGSHERRFPVSLIIFPIMIPVILNWVVQVPNGSSGRPNKILHRAIFEEGGLEGSLAQVATI